MSELSQVNRPVPVSGSLYTSPTNISQSGPCSFAAGFGTSAIDRGDNCFAVYRFNTSAESHCRVIDLLGRLKILMHDIRESKPVEAVFHQTPCMFSDLAYDLLSQYIRNIDLLFCALLVLYY